MEEYTMFKHLLSFGYVLCLSLTIQAGEVNGKRFPDGPDTVKTPGVLCTNPDTYRYEEKIPYCERSVSSGMKKKIIAAYDSELDFDIQMLPRGDFKIDHLIPLSIGGANDVGNLWPQHKSIYAYSDMIESHLSNLMVKGLIKQAEAIDAILTCKLHLEKCKQIEDDLAKRL
jgi:hypothetical protein